MTNENNQSKDLVVFQSGVPAVPNDPEELDNYIKKETIMLNAFKVYLKSGKVPIEQFDKFLAQGQELGENILYAKVELGKFLRDTPSAQGKRTDLGSVGKKVKSKKRPLII